MQPRHLDDLVIAEGATESAVIDRRNAPYSGLTHIVFYSPATLAETATLYSAKDASAVFGAHQSAGSDITFPADKRTTVDVRGIGALKIVLSVAAPAGGRTFGLSGDEPYPT